MAYALAETWTLPASNLFFNTGLPDETGCVYWITEDAGWRGGAAPRSSRNDKSYGPGQYRRPNWPTGLVVTWHGHVFAPDAASRAAAERKLATIGRDVQNLFQVICQDSVGPLYAMMEMDGPVLMQALSLTDFGFSMQLAAPDPRRYLASGSSSGNTALQSSSGGLDWATGGGLDWATGGGLNWGSVSSTGQLVFTNNGTAPSDPVFTITCPSGTLLNPMVTLVSSGQRLRYSGTLSAGDSLRIDTSAFTRSVVLNASQDVRVRMDLAEWFQIPAGGTAAVLFTADNVNAAANLNGTLNIAYW